MRASLSKAAGGVTLTVAAFHLRRPEVAFVLLGGILIIAVIALIYLGKSMWIVLSMWMMGVLTIVVLAGVMVALKGH
jgi:hypothetical protein